jgi:hypothetical protein
MKLLVAIPSSNPKKLARRTLKWASRAGFEMRIFTDPKISKTKYRNAIDDANYKHRLAVKHSDIVAGKDVLTYAQENDYDLLALVPPDMASWNKTIDSGKMVIEFHADLGAARKKISEDNTLHEVKFDNGARLVRVVKL